MPRCWSGTTSSNRTRQNAGKNGATKEATKETEGNTNDHPDQAQPDLQALLAACPKISWLAGWRASVGDNYSRRLQPLASQ